MSSHIKEKPRLAAGLEHGLRAQLNTVVRKAQIGCMTGTCVACMVDFFTQCFSHTCDDRLNVIQGLFLLLKSRLRECPAMVPLRLYKLQRT